MTVQAISLDQNQSQVALEVFRNGRFEADGWRRLPEDEGLPADGGVLLSVSRLIREADAGSLANRPVGVIVEPADRVSDLLPYLGRVSVVAINFPKFNDGRGFSHAALLGRAGFSGEVRAVGNVLIDQVGYMRRLGFTAFEVSHPTTRRYMAEGRDPAPRRYYQPAVAAEAPAGTRPWLRRAAEAAAG